MFANLWAFLAMLVAGAVSVGILLSILRPFRLRGVRKVIDAEPGRPGLRDSDIAQRLSGQSPPSTAVVASGSRGGAWWLALSLASFVLSTTAVFSESPRIATVATLSMVWSAFMGWRFGLGRQLRVNSTEVQLRRAFTTFTIPRERIRAVGLVPSGSSAGINEGGVLLSMWVDPQAVAGLPTDLSADVTVRQDIAWLRLDDLESVSTAQILGLQLAFGPQWTIADADGVLRPAVQAELHELFAQSGMTFDGHSGRYLHGDRTVGLALQRKPRRLQAWHAKLTRDKQQLPYRYEVRDSQLRTHWVISKPDSVWKTAFYVTDRHGNRIGTFRATSDTSTNFDLCGVDNRTLATLRPHERFSSIVDTYGNQVASWDADTRVLTNQAPEQLRLLCALAPIVAMYVGPHAKPSGLLQLESGPKDRTWALHPEQAAAEQPHQPPDATRQYGWDPYGPAPTDATQRLHTGPGANEQSAQPYAHGQQQDFGPAPTRQYAAAQQNPSAAATEPVAQQHATQQYNAAQPGAAGNPQYPAGPPNHNFAPPAATQQYSAAQPGAAAGTEPVAQQHAGDRVPTAANAKFWKWSERGPKDRSRPGDEEQLEGAGSASGGAAAKLRKWGSSLSRRKG